MNRSREKKNTHLFHSCVVTFQHPDLLIPPKATQQSLRGFPRQPTQYAQNAEDIKAHLNNSLSPAELQSRLARRNSATLRRPPRFNCISIRASDTRIDNNTAIINPYRAIYPRTQPYPHQVVIDHKLIEHLVKPFELLPNMDWTDVANGLGVHPESLRHSMKSGRFRLHHYKLLGGKRGKPVPVFLNFETLDPNSGRNRLPNDPLWGQMWRYNADRFPKDFEQAITRDLVFASYQGQPRFRGYRWLCPKCEKKVRILYYPLPPLNLPRYFNHDPAAQRNDQLIQHSAFKIQNSTFACHHGHRIKFFTRMDRNGWNDYITYTSAGLLYGHEVEKPKNFHDFKHRKRKYRPNFNTPPSPRREQVKTLLLQGLTYHQIAKELKVGYSTVHQHVKILYKQASVKSRQELARKERITLPAKRLSERQQAIEQLLLTNQTYTQIAQSLHLTYDIVHHTAKFLYQHYKVHGRKELGDGLKFEPPVSTPADRPDGMELRTEI